MKSWGRGALRQDGGTIVDICGGVCPLLFPLGNRFFSVLGGSDGLLIIEPRSLALLVHSGYHRLDVAYEQHRFVSQSSGG